MRVGIVLEHDRAIAVARGGRVARVVVPFDPASPARCVEGLRAALGDAPVIKLAIGLAFLEPAAPALPPVGFEARQQMLALETDRWFPGVGASAAVALVGDGPLAFATDAARLGAWLAAFEQWGRIESVEPAPCAMARVLRLGTDCEATVASAPGETGLLRFVAGRLVLARRLPPGVSPSRAALEWRDATHEADAARSALESAEIALHAQLLPVAVRRTFGRRRQRAVAFAWAALAAAIVFCSASVARWRERTLNALVQESARLQPTAEAALAQRAQLQSLRDESATVTRVQRDGARPSRVLALVARRLPHDATLNSVRADSSGWEIGGVARDAVAVVRALALDPALTDVRAIGGTNRAAGSRGAEESFTIGFRVRGVRAPH